MNHQGLNFLVDNAMFQERYIETVICKIFYDAKCYTGRMNLAQFRQSQFTETIQSLNAETDLNHDHDLLIYESDLLNYNGGILSEKLVHQIMQRGRIPAFSRRQSKPDILTYLDYIWFLISEVDKSTPVAIEYWFRCLDEDGDGIITYYDLEQHWKDQEKRLRHMVETYRYHFEEFIKFEDIMRQINDLVQPQVPGQFRLLDLKKNGLIAEKFFDTFINFDKFQIHDAYQTLYRANPHLTGRKNAIQTLSESVIIEPFTLGSWYEYADQEYQYLILNEQEDDWSIQLPEKEEKDIECDEEAGSDSDNSTPSTPKLEPSSSQTDKETTQGKEEEEEEEQGKNWIWNSVL
ncbi:hypothetical protein RMCBS344292_00404 [Rhizopus microsporus]|nr:hypothetical protein RMCBS344292_00404 [Rhizopus microsporus]